MLPGWPPIILSRQMPLRQGSSDGPLSGCPGLRIVCARPVGCGPGHKGFSYATADRGGPGGILLCCGFTAGAATAESPFFLVALSSVGRTPSRDACGPLPGLGFALGCSAHAGIPPDKIVAGSPDFSGH